MLTLDKTCYSYQSPLNKLASENKLPMSVTLGTSHSRIDPCEPPEPSPFGESFRHAPTALSRPALDADKNAEGSRAHGTWYWSGWTCKHFRLACLWMGPSIPAQLLFEANFITFVAVIRVFSVAFPVLKYKNYAQNTNISSVSLAWTCISCLQAFPACFRLILGVKSCCNTLFFCLHSAYTLLTLCLHSAYTRPIFVPKHDFTTHPWSPTTLGINSIYITRFGGLTGTPQHITRQYHTHFFSFPPSMYSAYA